MTFDEFLRRIDVKGKNSDGSYRAICPGHDDQNTSLSVKEGEVQPQLYCFALCEEEQILRGLGLTKKDIYYKTGIDVKKENTARPTPVGPLLKYPIKTVEGHTVAIRTKQRLSDGKKDLRWEQPDGRPGLGGAKTAELPLYGSERIPEFLASRWIELCEGEGAAFALNEMGANALGTSTGAGSCPTPGVFKSLLGFRVRLWPDNDQAGAKHMQRIAEILKDLDIQHVILDTSTLPAKGDAVEWIDRILKAGTEKIRLVRIIQDEDRKDLPGLPLLVPGQPTAAEKEEAEKHPEKAAKRAEEKEAEAKKTKERIEAQKARIQNGPPAITITGEQLNSIVDKSWAAIHKAAVPDPIMFRRAGSLVAVDQDGDSAPIVREYNEASMRLKLSQVAQWYKIRGNSDGESKLEATFPPREVVQSVLAVVDKTVPALDLVSNSPLFSPVGEICSKQGYNAAGKVWLTKAAEIGLKLPDPTKENALAALDFLLNDFLHDFKFAQLCDRANCLAALILPAVRAMIPGPTPLHDVNSPVQRVGKSLLVSAITSVYLGSPVVGQGLPLSEEEVAKTLIAELIQGRPFVFFDNGDNKERRVIDSGSLEGVLTGLEWTSRELGKSRMIPAVAVRAVWFITGVNLEFKKGLMGRRVRIRLDPKLEDPSKRTGFKHPKILQWTKENRAAILSAIFTIVSHYLSINPELRPVARTLGGYEDWSQLIGGILESVDVVGFLEHQDDPEDNAAEDGADEWEEFVQVWWKEFQNYPQSIAKLNDMASNRGLLDEIRGEKSKPSQIQKLGFALKKIRGRVFGTKRVTYAVNTHSKNPEYSLKELNVKEENPPF